MDRPGALRLTVLGPVRAVRDGRELDLGSAQQRAVLGILLAATGGPVGLRELVAVLWRDEPPASAVNIVQRHVGTLRRLLEPGLPTRSAGGLILRAAGGYRLEGASVWCDLREFRLLAAQARAVEDADPAEAVRLWSEALDLRSGPVAAGLGDDVRAHPLFTAVEREYLAVLRRAADVALDAGLAEVLAARVQEAAEEHPLDESLQARLIRALAATGRRTDAFELYQEIRSRLADDLGVDPGAELLAAHTAILRERPEVPDHRPAVPAQLPTDLAAFTGREGELKELVDLASAAGDTSPVVIGAIGGTAGIGKTTLAVRLAHLLAARFPDGQLYANLRGFDASGEVMAPSEALRGFLDAFGVDPRRVPIGLDAQSALYRSSLAGKRVLVLLDNARDAAQVQPLLPGSPGCLAIVTSRKSLSALVAVHGARSVQLDLLPPEEARDFLARRLGAERVHAECAAVDRIIELCSRLPLALATVAARAAVNRTLTLSDIAGDLDRTRGDLSAFTGPESAIDVRAAFSWSYDGLGGQAARLFRLIALHPTATGAGVDAPAVAALAGQPLAQVRTGLAELCDAQLLIRPSAGRFAFHDLLRAYAAELATAVDSPADRHEAVRRLVEHYEDLTVAADRVLAPDPLADELPADATKDEAVAWLSAERAALVAAVELADREGLGERAWTLAAALANFLERWGHWADWLATQRVALRAATRLGDTPAQADAHRSLGLAASKLGHDAEAREHLVRASKLAGRLDDPVQQALALRSLAADVDRRGEPRHALELSVRAHRLYEEAGNQAAAGNALNEIGWYHAQLGELAEGLAACEQALATLTSFGSPRGVAAAWDSLGYIHRRLGNVERAIECYRTAVARRREVGDRHPEASSLVELAETRLDAGEREEARVAFTRALEILRDLGHPSAETVAARLSALGPG